MTWMDLTMLLDEKTPVYPGDPCGEFSCFANIDREGWNAMRMTFNTHFGTHMDAPLHMVKDGKSLDTYLPERFVGKADVNYVRGHSVIKPEHCYLDRVRKGDFVFFYTGHSEEAHGSNYYKTNPVLSLELAQQLVEKKVGMVGLDSWTPDNAPYDLHKLFFRNDILILENLVGLAPIADKRVDTIVAPLKIRHADGAPCRVFARTP
ncbi:cyclase family protein [Candidatus Micrarchaeota archaeon]|nr:cyclase family protein [Candidatus Micrarchaeota archaeon]